MALERYILTCLQCWICMWAYTYTRVGVCWYGISWYMYVYVSVCRNDERGNVCDGYLAAADGDWC